MSTSERPTVDIVTTGPVGGVVAGPVAVGPVLGGGAAVDVVSGIDSTVTARRIG